MQAFPFTSRSDSHGEQSGSSLVKLSARIGLIREARLRLAKDGGLPSIRRRDTDWLANGDRSGTEEGVDQTQASKRSGVVDRLRDDPDNFPGFRNSHPPFLLVPSRVPGD